MSKKIFTWIFLIVFIGIAINLLFFSWGISLHEEKRTKSAIYTYKTKYSDAKIQYNVLQDHLIAIEHRAGKKIKNMNKHERAFYDIDKTLEDMELYKLRMNKAGKKLLDLGVSVDSI
jgi:hypothetical protein